ncbi:cation:proton antiporter [Hazenella sp. IB182357]|uniref:Cation:proton antiporter n=1 Tax=Polycladospora coralii TaxID=2771432 RepID=A0A926RSR1_9BACL|nr:cation:proton antiporter [Polycladospora coralii]MBD1371745.1 cation:proton antiporter [Polycladospora coralii]MBS7529212.1 cation:proton antiporter [Polycladospora coralii]
MFFFFQLLLILVAVKFAGDLSARLGQPAVLGKLLVGVLVGPAMLGFIESSDIITELSQIGVLLLMFIAGLETDVDQLNKTKRSSFAVAVGGILLPLLGGYIGGIAFGMSQFEAIFIGLLLSATSVSISVQTLRDLGQLKSKESATILGAAIVDDILVVILLAFTMSFVGSGDALSLVIGKKFLFFVLVIGICWKVVPWLMRLFARLRITEAVMSGAMVILLGLAFMAEKLGVAGIIGAFAAGIAISQTSFKHVVEEKIEPIAYVIFVPIFFISIGLNVSFVGLSDQILFITIFTIIGILSKLIGSGLGARLTGYQWKSALGIGSGMISRGEVALIIATIGKQADLLSDKYYTSIVIVILITTLVTPPLLKIIFGEKKVEPPEKMQSA